MGLVLRQDEPRCEQSCELLTLWVSQCGLHPPRLFLLKIKWDQHFQNNLGPTGPAPLWPFSLQI